MRFILYTGWDPSLLDLDVVLAKQESSSGFLNVRSIPHTGWDQVPPYVDQQQAALNFGNSIGDLKDRERKVSSVILTC